MEMDPATAIIRKLGGEAKVAGIAGTALIAGSMKNREAEPVV